MGEKVSMRQAGKEILGKLYKGPITDAYNRLSQPSIPTKLEQILCGSNKFFLVINFDYEYFLFIGFL